MTAAQTFPSSLVLGAAGFFGINLVDALVARGQSPRCGRRARTNVLALRQRKAPLVQTDFDLPDTLRAAMAGIDTVFHLGGHYPRLSLEPQKERALGLARLENVLDAAASSGVRRLLYVSSTATVAPRADGRPSTEADVFSAPPPWGAYHDLKWHLDGLVSWVDARDVANALVAMATHEAPPRRVLVAAESLQLHHLLEVAAAFYGVTAPAPMSDADALAFADDEEHRAAAGGPRARLARELVDLIIHGPAIDASLVQRALGIDYRPLDTTLVDFDAWARRVGFIPTKAQEQTA